MTKFVMYKNFWWEYDETSHLDYARLYDHCGICAFGVDARNLKMCEAQDFENLDWNNTPVLNNTSVCGWLDRNGKFYGCDFTEHVMQAEYVHHSSILMLESLGWIHISYLSKFNQKPYAFYGADYKNGVIPTDSQMKYLSNHLEVDSSMVLEAYENGNRQKARIYEQNLLKKSNEFAKEDMVK